MAQNLQTKKTNFMNRFVAASQALLNARESLRALKSEWDANSYSTAIVQGDIDLAGGSNQHLTPTVMANMMNLQIALEALLNNAVPTQGSWITNLEAMIS